ncbi:TonB-dependent siderophore receptor [Methylocella tundrae]|uniref:TonB-dependent siderophore receptor n=1 Tax=Methylocella tundrae TaxID=227605 RepID=A0A8B6M4X6_METTU|nr:TonB-dependent siderophore receptor [Methylocella tundrae]VTZ22681.1 TonB-dependent siderophore receptor [Methylocella tundrae]VTZ49875.1 TonB-dependent siderophore receptor [Methylocella tundrae]
MNTGPASELSGSQRKPQSSSTSGFILAKARRPIAHAAVSLASVMLADAALAQDAAAPEGDPIALEQVDVSGQGQGGGSDYNPRTLGLKRIATPILDTPQSITVVPQQLIQDQKDSTVVEALHNVPGVTFFGGEGGTQGDNVSIHGYTARNDFYRDGVRDPGWYTRDTFSIQEIEVLKGPASFLFGRGSTGGVINMTSKLPVFTNFTTVEMSGYTAPGARVTADINRTFADTAARIILLGNDTDVAGRDHINTKRIGVAPSITMNMTQDTRVTLSYVYQRDDNIPDYGIPLLPAAYFGTPYGKPAPVAANTYYGRLSSGFSDAEKVSVNIVTARIEHDFNADWQGSNVTRYSYVDRFVRIRGVQTNTGVPYATAVGGSALTSAQLFNFPLDSLYYQNTNDFQNHTQNSLLTNQSDLVGHFDTGFLRHTILAGLELSQETRDQYRTNIIGGDRVNIGEPNPYPVNPGYPNPTSTDQYSLARTIGVYANDQVKIGPYFEVLGGLRFDDFKIWQNYGTVNTGSKVFISQVNAATPYNINSDTNFLSWRAGGVFHPVPNASIYYIYGTSFDPSSEFLTLSGGQQNLQPTTNQNMELGAKIDLLESRLSLTGALFQVTQENAVETVNAAAGLYAQIGKTRVQGGEIGVAGKITDAWSIFGGYTYMDGRVLASGTTAAGAFISPPGNKLPNVPRNTFTVTSSYAITAALTAGASAYFVDSRYTNSANTGWVPGYWRFDLFGSYKIDEHFSVQANIYNIADTKNFETISGYGSATPGPGRSAVLTAKMTF